MASEECVLPEKAEGKFLIGNFFILEIVVYPCGNNGR